MRHSTLVIALAVGVLAGAQVQSQPGLFSHGWIVPAEEAAGKQLFKNHCAVCHSPRAGQPFGPSLVGVVGRPAGSVPGFPYSEALKKSGLIWTDDNLRNWIAHSSQMVPDTRMPHASVTDPAEQLYIVAYLKTLKPSNAK